MLRNRQAFQDVFVICSSPNGRGIHRYAKGICTAVNESVLIEKGESLIPAVCWEIIWPLANCKFLSNHARLFIVNTRVSPLLWLRRSKVIVVVHDAMDTLISRRVVATRLSPLNLFAYLVNTVWIVASIRRSKHVVFNSNATRRCYRKFIGGKETSVVYPHPSFDSSFDRAGSTRGVVSESYRILSVTGRSRNKALDEYIVFARLLRKRIEGFKLILVGVEWADLGVDGELEDELAKSCIECKRGISDNELVEEYLNCDLYLSLSADEGFGIPLDDALGFGIKCVASMIDAYIEIYNIHDCGASSYLVENVEKAVNGADAILRAMNPEEKESRDSRRIRRYQEHSIRRIQQSTVQVGLIE